MTWLIVFCSLVFAFGLAIGAVAWDWLRDRLEARAEREERCQQQAEAEADEYVGQLLEPLPVHEISPGPWIERIPPAFPPWSLLNADPPTLDEEIRAMIANANAVPSVRWLDQLS